MFLESSARLSVHDHRVAPSVSPGTQVTPRTGIYPRIFRRKVDDAQASALPDHLLQIALIRTASVRSQTVAPDPSLDDSPTVGPGGEIQRTAQELLVAVPVRREITIQPFEQSRPLHHPCVRIEPDDRLPGMTVLHVADELGLVLCSPVPAPGA